MVHSQVLIWKNTSPEKSFCRDLAIEILRIVEKNINDMVIPIKSEN